MKTAESQETYCIAHYPSDESLDCDILVVDFLPEEKWVPLTADVMKDLAQRSKWVRAQQEVIEESPKIFMPKNFTSFGCFEVAKAMIAYLEEQQPDKEGKLEALSLTWLEEWLH